jgi:hypothetical protein
VAAPDGSLLAAAGAGEELLFARLELAGPPEPAPDAGSGDVAYLRDLRPETYRSWGS